MAPITESGVTVKIGLLQVEYNTGLWSGKANIFINLIIVNELCARSLSSELHMHQIFTVFAIRNSTKLKSSYLFLHRKDFFKKLSYINKNYGLGLRRQITRRRLEGAVGHVEILPDILSKHFIFSVGDACVQTL